MLREVNSKKDQLAVETSRLKLGMTKNVPIEILSLNNKSNSDNGLKQVEIMDDTVYQLLIRRHFYQMTRKIRAE